MYSLNIKTCKFLDAERGPCKKCCKEAFAAKRDPILRKNAIQACRMGCTLEGTKYTHMTPEASGVLMLNAKAIKQEESMSAAMEKMGSLAQEMYNSESTIIQISSCAKLHHSLGWFCFQGSEFYQLLRKGNSVREVVKSASKHSK